MICPRCRAVAPDEATYCSRCGEGLVPGARPAQVVINVPNRNDDPFNRYVNQRPWLIVLIIVGVVATFLFLGYVEKVDNQQALDDGQKIQQQIENTLHPNQ